MNIPYLPNAIIVENINTKYITCAAADPIMKEDGDILFTLTFAVKAGSVGGDTEVTITSDMFNNYAEDKNISAVYVPGIVTIAGDPDDPTGNDTTGGSTTGDETIDFNVIDMTDGNTPDTTGAIWEFTVEDDTVTMTVTHDKACVVVVWDGEKYTKLEATENAAGGYDYDVSGVAATAEIIIAVKGDTSGDGVANATDARQIVVAANGGNMLKW